MGHVLQKTSAPIEGDINGKSSSCDARIGYLLRFRMKENSWTRNNFPNTVGVCLFGKTMSGSDLSTNIVHGVQEDFTPAQLTQDLEYYVLKSIVYRL